MKDFLDLFIGVNFSTYFAALALIVSLFLMFLTARQVSLLSRQLRLDSQIKISDANRQIISLGFDKPELWKIVDDSREILDAKKAEQRKRYLQLWFNHIQIVWKANDLGLFDQDEWRASRADIADFLTIRALRTHWSEVKRFYSKPFQKFIDSIIRDIDSK